VGTALFPTPCCANGPFYIGLEYVTGVSGTTPSILYDDITPTDTCVNWFYYSGLWYEWSDIWTPPTPGYPLFWVNGETQSPDCPEPCVWNPGDSHKMHFAQLPDEYGWDVNATNPLVLADDFYCSESGWIKDIHFWGSWRDDVIGEILFFNLSLHSDIPADPPQIPYSRPGVTLWELEVSIGDVDVIPIDPGGLEGWYDPSTGEVVPANHQSYFQYNVCLDSAFWFWQDEGTIYWLNISASLVDPQGTSWGWKNTQDHWNDDACWAYLGELNWIDLWEPYRQSSLDLSFVITGGREYMCGDVDASVSVDIDDVVYLIAYIFSAGPPPDPYLSGDVNCSGSVDIDDVVYLIAYIFSGGPPPCDLNNDGIPDC
jgi:hypothetical protein